MLDMVISFFLGVVVTALVIGTYSDYTSRKTMAEKCMSQGGVVVYVNEKRICTDKIIEKKITE